MPPYDFGTPSIIDELLKRLSQSWQPAEQPVEQKPEQPSGTDMVNKAISEGLGIERPPAPNPYELYAQQQILQAKAAYEGAQGIANAAADQYYGAQRNAQDPAQAAYVNQLTQATQQQSSKLAENIRAQMGAAGVDMSQYGSDVSLADANQRYATQQTQAIMQAMNGQYSLSADQFYEQEFLKGIMNGLSARRARRLAGHRAREYQADRVAYLDGLYNSYGRDELVTNELGNQIIGWMSQENPSLANYYAKIYPNARDAYKRQNELQDLALSHQYGFEDRADAARHNMNYADYTAILNSEREQERAANERAQAYTDAEIASRQTQIDFETKDRLVNNLADRMGLEGEVRNRFVAAGHGIQLAKNEKADNELLKSAENYMTRLINQANIHKDVLNSPNSSDEDKAVARSELQNIQEDLNTLNRRFDKMFGIDQDYELYSGNEEKDIQSVRKILSYIAQRDAGGTVTPDNAKAAIRQWANENEAGKKLSDEDIEALIIKASKTGR